VETGQTHLIRFAAIDSGEAATKLLREIFETVEALNPSKDSTAYWQAINRRMLGFNEAIRQMWSDEKVASSESITLARQEALTHLASERERFMRFSREEAIKEIIKASKIENKEKAVQSVSDKGLLEVE
jgi:type II restriction enzyme